MKKIIDILATEIAGSPAQTVLLILLSGYGLGVLIQLILAAIKGSMRFRSNTTMAGGATTNQQQQIQQGRISTWLNNQNFRMPLDLEGLGELIYVLSGIFMVLALYLFDHISLNQSVSSIGWWATPLIIIGALTQAIPSWEQFTNKYGLNLGFFIILYVGLVIGFAW